MKSLFVISMFAILLALPLACKNRSFSDPVIPVVAPTPTPTAVWSFQSTLTVAAPTATP